MEFMTRRPGASVPGVVSLAGAKRKRWNAQSDPARRYTPIVAPRQAASRAGRMGAILAPSLSDGSVPRGEDMFAGMRGAEAVEAGEGTGPGEIGGEGPDLGGGDGPGGETRVPRPGADEA